METKGKAAKAATDDKRDAADATAAATENPKANDTPPTIEQISGMIEGAAAKVATNPDFIDAIVDAVIAKTDFNKLTADAVESKLPTAEALQESVNAAVAEVDMAQLVDTALDGRAEREAAAQQQAQADEQARAAAAQRSAAAATRSAEKAVADADRAAQAKRQKAADRAEREYLELVLDPVSSAIDFTMADSIEVRFANGETFLPEFALGVESADLSDEDGRLILLAAIEPSRELVPFEASEAILLVEGGATKQPIGVWRAELFPPARIGGGALPIFPAGSLAFRKVEPVAADA